MADCAGRRLGDRPRPRHAPGRESLACGPTLAFQTVGEFTTPEGNPPPSELGVHPPRLPSNKTRIARCFGKESLHRTRAAAAPTRVETPTSRFNAVGARTCPARESSANGQAANVMNGSCGLHRIEARRHAQPHLPAGVGTGPALVARTLTQCQVVPTRHSLRPRRHEPSAAPPGAPSPDPPAPHRFLRRSPSRATGRLHARR